MTERQLQFRVGLFVLVTLAVATGLVVQFGEIRTWLRATYPIAVHFDSAAGLYPSSLVRRDGLRIGVVEKIVFDEKRPGVLVVVRIDEQYRLRVDAKARLTRSLLGDAALDIESGTSPQLLAPGAVLEGIPAEDPFAIVARLEQRLDGTLGAFEATSHEWQRVAKNLNSILETNQGPLEQVVERTAQSLAEFTRTMKLAQDSLNHANTVLGDPESQEHLKAALAGLPKLVQETRETVGEVRGAVGAVSANLKNLQQATDPLAEHSRSIVVKLDNTVGNLESMTGQLDVFARLLVQKDGTVQRLATDPQLYDNLNRSSASLSVLLRNLEPILADLRIFSDKVARHPELIGVSGALKGSSGLKDLPGAPNAPQPLRTGGDARPIGPFDRR